MRKFSFGIVGSGTAGLITALMLRQAFPSSAITIISSSQIGIIGVGEGSTEHWRTFMETCEIPLEKMIVATAATHKYGIRYEGWTQHTPDYFHSVGQTDDINASGLFATYMECFVTNKQLTPQFSSMGIIKNKIPKNSLHNSTNQFHFDTFKLNEYFTSLAFRRAIEFREGKVQKIEIDPVDGYIDTVTTDKNETVKADIWIDASGFSRILMKELGNEKWVSFSKYLLCDRAIPFPTESDPLGIIKPYTRAKAADAGWIWEIPTQERRGNGYVYCSQFIDDDTARLEVEKRVGYSSNSDRVISFDAGYMPEVWTKNCMAVGLSSAFVEPLEATSIGSTIQQIKMAIPHFASFVKGNSKQQKFYNQEFSLIAENILTMIRMHYYSDRADTPFWAAMSNMPINDGLAEIIDLWSERPPARNDFLKTPYQLFHAPHFAHVAQGQGLIPKLPSENALFQLDLQRKVEAVLDAMRHNSRTGELVDHAQALREIQLHDNDWR